MQSLTDRRAFRSRAVKSIRGGMLAVAFLGATQAIAQSAPAVLRRSVPTSLTDAEFWRLFTTMSEPSGFFLSENFVSNEIGFQNVIPELQRRTTPGGVYLGVGPEQNFTYIANLRPSMAFIIDIRRQNAMVHLMYKALFELSPTRREFVSRLFGRPIPITIAPSVGADVLFAAAVAAQADEAIFAATIDSILAHLTVRHHFDLTLEDRQTIRRVYAGFFDAGPQINYTYRTDPTRRFINNFSNYASYDALQSATNESGVPMAFLADEERYGRVRDLELKNLIVPLVGDFAGPTTIRAVGDYLRTQRATVMAFYLSNVEQYLYQDGETPARFYRNVETLPRDSASTFIRSVPTTDGNTGASMSGLTTGYVGGVRTWIYDSTGAVIRRVIDSTGRAGNATATVTVTIDLSTASLAIVSGNTLGSGLAGIGETLAAWSAGTLPSYMHVVEMTKTSGWK